MSNIFYFCNNFHAPETWRFLSYVIAPESGLIWLQQ